MWIKYRHFLGESYNKEETRVMAAWRPHDVLIIAKIIKHETVDYYKRHSGNLQDQSQVSRTIQHAIVGVGSKY